MGRWVRACSTCKLHKPLTEFYADKRAPDGCRAVCKTCHLEHQRNARARNPDHEREGRLRRKYGMTLQQYNEMLAAQGGRCAICGTDEPGGRYNDLHVDHCHETGKVRGLLCYNCNSALGRFKDDPEVLRNAINYLQESSHSI